MITYDSSRQANSRAHPLNRLKSRPSEEKTVPKRNGIMRNSRLETSGQSPKETTPEGASGESGRHGNGFWKSGDYPSFAAFFTVRSSISNASPEGVKDQRVAVAFSLIFLDSTLTTGQC
jgi:hypothetical protein